MTDFSITQEEKNLRYAHVERNLRRALNQGNRDEVIGATSFAMGILSILHPNPLVRILMAENKSLLSTSDEGSLRREAQNCLTLLDSLRAEK